MKKQVLVLLLVGIMFLTACAGTSPSPSAATPNAAATSAVAQGSTAAPEVEAEAETSFAGYPLQSTDTITWWVGAGYALNTAYAVAEESPFHAGLTDMTGVNIEWSFPTVGTDSVQAFNLLMASMDFPDIIYSDQLIASAERYMEEGVIRDLSNDMATHSPAYYKFLTGTEIYDKALKTDDGKYYGYGFFREDGGWNDSYLGPAVRMDKLAELGLEVPKTISEFDTALRAAKDKFAMAPLSFTWESRFRSHGFAGAYGAYGAGDYQMYVDDNNKVQYAQAQPEWRDSMAQLATWWADGLIDQDVLTMKDPEVQTKALNGDVIFTITSMGQLSNWEKDANAAGNGAQWSGIAQITADDGSISSVFGGTGIGTGVAVITTGMADEKLETAMRLLDYAYTEEGSLYWNFGKEGVSWERDANNEVVYTPLVTEDVDGLNNAISKYGGSTWSGNCVQSTRMLYLKNTEAALAANDIWYYSHGEDVAYGWTYPRTVTFTTQESNRMDELKSQIQTFTRETAVKYMTGDDSVDNFDAFLTALDSLGLEELLAIYQAGYDRYAQR